MKNSSNTVRVIAGKWRSRKLTFPDAPGLRPTADRVRETLFNWLQNYLLAEDCLDLFAGSGVCGIEALSRGARHVTFIDNSALTLASLRRNLSLLEAADFEIFQQDALLWLQKTHAESARQFGIVFVDPPFADGLQESACMLLEQSTLLKPRALIYVESAVPLSQLRLPQSWAAFKSARAGNVHFGLYRRQQDLVV